MLRNEVFPLWRRVPWPIGPRYPVGVWFPLLWTITYASSYITHPQSLAISCGTLPCRDEFPFCISFKNYAFNYSSLLDDTRSPGGKRCVLLSNCLVQITYCLTGSPLGFDKRQLIAFPANFPFQSLSGDQAGALSAIQSNNLKG